MANPQKENGYTAIANEILEHLSWPGMNGSELRVVLFVFRKTYGFQKKADRIPLSQFQKGTLMGRKQVVITLQSLVGKRTLLKDKNTYKFNKNWEEWLVGKRTHSGQKTTRASGQKPTKTSGQLPTLKRKKETIQKKDSDVPSQDIQEFIFSFKGINPSYERLFGNKTERACSERLLKKYGKEKMLATTLQLPEIIAKPYAPRITTPYELERNLGKLIIFVEQNKKIIKETKIAFA